MLAFFESKSITADVKWFFDLILDFIKSIF